MTDKLFVSLHVSVEPEVCIEIPEGKYAFLATVGRAWFAIDEAGALHGSIEAVEKEGRKYEFVESGVRALVAMANAYKARMVN